MEWYGIVLYCCLLIPVDCPSNVAGHICEEPRFEGYKTLVLDLDETLVSQAAKLSWRRAAVGVWYLGLLQRLFFSGGRTQFWEPLASLWRCFSKVVRVQSPDITSFRRYIALSLKWLAISLWFPSGWDWSIWWIWWPDPGLCQAWLVPPGSNPRRFHQVWPVYIVVQYQGLPSHTWLKGLQIDLIKWYIAHTKVV